MVICDEYRDEVEYEKATGSSLRRARSHQTAKAWFRSEGAVRLYRLRIGVFGFGGSWPAGRKSGRQRAPARGGRGGQHPQRHGTASVVPEPPERGALERPPPPPPPLQPTPPSPTMANY